MYVDNLRGLTPFLLLFDGSTLNGLHRLVWYHRFERCFVQAGIMRAKVTDNGVLIPRMWLEGIDEVEIHNEQSVIIVVPVKRDDPILDLGRQPIILEVDDAAFNHDRYLYDR